MEFLRRQNGVRERRRIGEMRKQVWAATQHAEAAIKEMESLKNCTVKLGMERGTRDPMYALQVAISPMDFRYHMLCDARNGFANVHQYARRVGEDTAQKIHRLLVDFCTDKDRMPR